MIALQIVSPQRNTQRNDQKEDKRSGQRNDQRIPPSSFETVANILENKGVLVNILNVLNVENTIMEQGRKTEKYTEYLVVRSKSGKNIKIPMTEKGLRDNVEILREFGINVEKIPGLVDGVKIPEFDDPRPNANLPCYPAFVPQNQKSQKREN